MGLFTPLTYEQKYGHLSNPSGVLASGQANFEDPLQIETTTVFTSSVPLLNRNGLVYTENNYLSNAKQSRDFSINDFQVFNPYIHYYPSPNAGNGIINKKASAFEINTSGFYNLAVSGFNMYNTKYRPLS
jgi:hypothetical protein